MIVKSQQADLYKEIMGGYPTGVTIITTKDKNNHPVGLTANSFASVSIDPLLILWCIDKGSGSYETFNSVDAFAVNILSGEQKDACFTFASRKEKDRFSKVEWELSSNDLPILKNIYAVLECKKVQQVDAGDHLILIGEVVDLQKNDIDPMLYYRRNVGFIPDNWGDS
ncbi:flavin reductase family protein [Siminovitchia sediminis]|uniref:Flavin reductase family protein n=1 Tax=Siminovitchia sediminis TaxID=1274353 RepID=A0ABW4KM94_9BACI